MAGAASFAMKEQAVKAEQIGEAADIIEAACCCGIPEMVAYATDILQGLSVEAAGFMELAGTAQSISSVVRFGNIRHLDSTPLLPVLNQMFLRACLVFLNSCTCGSQAEKGVMEAMDQLNSLCLHHDFLDEERFIRLLAETASRDDLNTGISGFAAAILLERGRMEEEELSRQVRRRLSRGIPAELGAGWFAGLSKKNRYALIARLDLWRELSAIWILWMIRNLSGPWCSYAGRLLISVPGKSWMWLRIWARYAGGHGPGRRDAERAVKGRGNGAA